MKMYFLVVTHDSSRLIDMLMFSPWKYSIDLIKYYYYNNVHVIIL